MRRLLTVSAVGGLLCLLMVSPSTADTCPPPPGSIGTLVACGTDGVWAGGVAQLPTGYGWEVVYQRGGSAVKPQTSVWSNHLTTLFSAPDPAQCVVNSVDAEACATHTPNHENVYDPGAQMIAGSILAEWHEGFAVANGGIFASTHSLSPTAEWSSQFVPDSANAGHALSESSLDLADGTAYLTVTDGAPGANAPLYTQLVQNTSGNWSALQLVIACGNDNIPCVTPGPNPTGDNQQRANVAFTGSTEIAVWNGALTVGQDRKIWAATWVVGQGWAPSSTPIASATGSDLFNPFAVLVSTAPAKVRVYFTGLKGVPGQLGYVESTNGVNWTSPQSAGLPSVLTGQIIDRPVMAVNTDGHVVCLCSWHQGTPTYFYLYTIDLGAPA